MGEAKLYGKSGGGLKIDGIIANYYAYAGENISAGSFVEFINGVASQTNQNGSIKQLVSGDYNGYVISAVLLPNGNVFIAHSNSSSYYYLYGIVVTIDGTTITAGSDTALSTTRNTGWAISAKLLPNGNVFVSHSCSQNASMTSYYLHGMVVTIDGTTITAGTDTELATVGYGGYTISTEVLPNGDIFVVHSYTSTYDLYGIVCKVSGTSITAGADTSINTTNNTGNTISTTLLPSGNVFIAHSYGSDKYLYGIICAVSGTTISKGTDTALISSSNAGYSVSVVTLEDGNVFIAHSYGNSYHLYGIVCTISGTKITVGNDTAINTTLLYPAYKGLETILLESGDILILHGVHNTEVYQYGIVVTISDTAITAGEDTSVYNATNSGYEISAMLLKNGTIFTAFSNGTSYGLSSRVIGVSDNIPITTDIPITTYETQVRKATSQVINGVAKTNGTGGSSTAHGESLSVYVVPNYYEQFNMVQNEDFDNAENTWYIRTGSNGFEFISNDFPTQNPNTKTLRLYRANEDSYVSGVDTTNQFTVVTGHKYYIRCYYKFTDITNVNYGEFIVASYVRTTLFKTATDWTLASNLFSMTANDYSLRATIRTIQTDSSLRDDYPELFVNGIKCYDLTEIFGAGNEPDKTWCDKYLS